MFGKIGLMELIVIFAIALLVVGPKRLPQVGGAIGNAIREFKKGAKDIQDTIDTDTTIEPVQPQTVTLKAEPVQQAAKTDSGEATQN